MVLPASLLISFSYAKRKRRGLYAGTCSYLLQLQHTLLLCFTGCSLRNFTARYQLGKPFSFAGWLVALYLITVVWSKVRLANGLAS
jgi:hypothetical protein